MRTGTSATGLFYEKIRALPGFHLRGQDCRREENGVGTQHPQVCQKHNTKERRKAHGMGWDGTHNNRFCFPLRLASLLLHSGRVALHRLGTKKKRKEKKNSGGRVYRADRQTDRWPSASNRNRKDKRMLHG